MSVTSKVETAVGVHLETLDHLIAVGPDGLEEQEEPPPGQDLIALEIKRREVVAVHRAHPPTRVHLSGNPHGDSCESQGYF